MHLCDRKEAGDLLAKLLILTYRNKNVIVYGIPRGGVILASQIAKKLDAPLQIVLSKKIGYPLNPEYAIAAISEHGHLVYDSSEIDRVNKIWLAKEIIHQQKQMKQRRVLYLLEEEKTLRKKIVILVDDGIATGLSIKAAIADIKDLHPHRIVIATPIIAASVFPELKKEANEILALEVTNKFLGGVSAYYQKFPQVSDEEVIQILHKKHV